MDGYITIKEIPSAVKFGRDWAIPKDVERPKDARVTTGEYRGWRKKKETSYE